MKRLLAKWDVDCKCGHSPGDDGDQYGSCTAKDTRYALKKPNRVFLAHAGDIARAYL